MPDRRKDKILTYNFVWTLIHIRVEGFCIIWEETPQNFYLSLQNDRWTRQTRSGLWEVDIKRAAEWHTNNFFFRCFVVISICLSGDFIKYVRQCASLARLTGAFPPSLSLKWALCLRDGQWPGAACWVFKSCRLAKAVLTVEPLWISWFLQCFICWAAHIIQLLFLTAFFSSRFLKDCGRSLKLQV